MVGDYAEQCSTYGKGYQNATYHSHNARIGKERMYAKECQNLIKDVEYKKNKETELKKYPKKSSSKSRSKSHSKSYEKSRKKQANINPKKSKKKSSSVIDFPFEQVEIFLSILKRYQEEHKPLNQKLSGNVVLNVPEEFVNYDELREISKGVVEAKQNYKELSKIDVLVTRVNKVLDKYKEKLDLEKLGRKGSCKIKTSRSRGIAKKCHLK